MRTVITDIWFYSKIEIRELAEKIGLTNINCDSGDCWRWLSGELLDFKLDITQTNTLEDVNARTRVFLFDKDLQFSAGFTDYLAEKLKALGITPVYLGRWVSVKDGQYEQIIVKVET